MDLEKEDIPKSVLSYYVQLYSRKKKNRESDKKKGNVVTDATRSWLNLSASKKKLVLMKYNNCYLNLRKRFADKLRNAVPSSSSYQTKEITVDTVNTSNSIIDSYHNKSASEDIEDINTIFQNSHLEGFQDHYSEPEQSNNPVEPDISRLSEENIAITEPVPPMFRTGKEFYYIINNTAEDIVKWEHLTPAQRRPYNTASCRVKRLYLMEYTNYLENLSNANLIAHYEKVLKA